MAESVDAFAKEEEMGMEMMEEQPIARAILIHSPEEAKQERGYAVPGLDNPRFPSVKSPIHGSGKGADIFLGHIEQHESITWELKEKNKKACIELLEQLRKLDRKIEDLKKTGKTENLEELQSRSDKAHAYTAVECKTPE
jgi:hypothetical protein